MPDSDLPVDSRMVWLLQNFTQGKPTHLLKESVEYTGQ